MDTVELVLFAFGVLLIVTIVAVLVRIHYIIQQQGVQISILLKHEKEGYTPWMRYARQRNFSDAYDNNLLPEGKQLKHNNSKLVINNTRAMQPCHTLSTEQLNKYAAAVIQEQDGLNGHAETAADLNITAVDSMQAGNLKGVDFAVNNIPEDNGAPVDQSGVAQNDFASEETAKASVTGNLRTVPAIVDNMTTGVKQANESFKSRYRLLHSGRRNY